MVWALGQMKSGQRGEFGKLKSEWEIIFASEQCLVNDFEHILYEMSFCKACVHLFGGVLQKFI